MKQFIKSTWIFAGFTAILLACAPEKQPPRPLAKLPTNCNLYTDGNGRFIVTVNGSNTFNYRPIYNNPHDAIERTWLEIRQQAVEQTNINTIQWQRVQY